MFFYLFSILSNYNNSKNTKIFNSDNSDNFVDLELGLNFSDYNSTFSYLKKNNKILPTIIIHRFRI